MDADSPPASWLLLSSETSTPGPDSFKSHEIGGVEAGLHLVASHLRGRSCRAHKSRVDLDALACLHHGNKGWVGARLGDESRRSRAKDVADASPEPRRRVPLA